MGFIIEKNDVALLFTLDTGPTDKIWEVSRRMKNLKGIFTEVSFPNNQSEVATISHHHTPNSLMQELSKMPPGVPVILTHMKPYFRDDILRELNLLNNPRLQVLKVDGEVFYF
jgi:cAMP phosphodiesterase